jgi:PAS domain S-box-containing protein
MKSRSWIISILVLLSLSSYLFYYFYGVERARTIDGVVNQQRILARQAAKSLNELFAKWNSVLSYLSNEENVILMNDRGQRELTQLREILRDEIKSITRTDRNGVIIYTAPFFPNSLGRNISQQKHMTKILADHAPVVSDVFDAVQGFQAIAIHYPVHKDGAFDGTLAFVIDFGRVGRTILEDIGSDGSGYAWMLSSEGIELYCPVPGHIGKSIRETAKGFPELLSVVDSMLAGKEGSATYTYDMVATEQKMARKIVYYLPVHVNETFWPLAIAYSEESITTSLASFSTKLILIIGCLFIGGVFISYFGIKAWVVVREADAKQRSEEKLRESEERYRNLYNNAVIGIYRMTSKGTILFANPHLVRMLGFESFEELVRHNAEESGFALNHRSPGFESTLRGEQEVRGIESRWQKSDGTEIFVRENVRVFYHDDGSVDYYDITAEDITEQKKLQDQLLQSQKMEAIGQLAGGVAHDFNNMIGVILGFAMMMERDLPPTDPAQRKIRSIINAAERSANLAKQLLAFARRQVITPIVVNLNREISSIRKMLERIIGENITMNFVLGEGLWNVKMDPVQIDQIITNLCTNARDAIENIGVITIETSNLTVDRSTQGQYRGLAPGEYVVLSVSDTGHGIDTAMLERIYEPFFTTKPKGKGTGLGLATVFGIVKQNNGHIDFESTRGKGTTFRVYLVRSFGEMEEREEVAETIPARGTGTVLVVEDEEELLAFIASTLEAQGYTTLRTTSPHHALKLCAEIRGSLDLLITDVIMPEMNGKELQKEILKLFPRTKTLFISGYTADVVAERGILEKEVSFLQKPFTPKTLLRKVYSVLSET